MFRAIASFEIRYHLKSPLFWILFLIYFLLTFGAVASDAVQIGGSIGHIHRNAPYVIMQILLVMSIFGTLTTTAFVANSIHRDFELNTDSLFFSSPIRKWHYVVGRFTGSFIVAVMVYLGVVTAIMIGSLMPWVPKEELGPFSLYPYLFSLFVLVAPNLLLFGAIFFAVAALTRSLMATYASVVAMFVLYAAAGFIVGDIENETIAGLMDPFGLGAFALATRYWTVFHKNTQVISLEGIYLLNRLFWIGIAALFVAFAYWKFQLTTGTRKSRRMKLAADAEESKRIDRTSLPLPRAKQIFSSSGSLRQFAAAVRMESRGVFTSIPFWIMLALGIFFVAAGTLDIEIFGTPMYPVTAMMVQAIWDSFGLFALLIATFYAGDLVWRERTLKMHDVHDAMPVPTWTQWAAKFTSLVLIMFATFAMAMLTTLIIQTARGYHNYEFALYAKGLFGMIGARALLLMALAFLLQIFFGHRLIGFLGMMLWFVLNIALPRMGYESLLYRYAAGTGGEYSDMNGYGHFVKPMVATNLYWFLFVAMMLAIGHLFWTRGTETRFRQRLRIARQRLNPRIGAVIALLFIAFVSTGCYIYYNTHSLNTYRTRKDVEKLQATAEKKYKKYEGIPQPRIVAVQANVDIHPEKRAVYINGTYTAVNKSGVPIRDLHVIWLPATITSFDATIPGAKLKSDDREIGYRIYTLDQPLAPGASMTMKFKTAYEAKGFPHRAANNQVVENGTFINNFEYFPHFGYSSRVELDDRNVRRKHGLPPPQRLKPPTDMKARQENQLGGTDWLSLDTTVSTSGDQIALAPGYLQRSWAANGRRYFHYKSTSPILGFWSYLSARYQVKRDHWKGIPIEVYYDKKHPYNVDRMIDSVKKSLDYFTTNFSPYQHKQVRILEFPRYRTFAQSFPNTIPYSEGIGFIADLRDEDSIDYVFYVTAHEIAHQWWAHQVIGGNVQGSTMIVETMAQYSALMVMEKEYGKAQMQRFLRYELDRYLSGRGRENIAEKPLMLVENQDYIHYRKGSLVMYALRDYIGEERVNRALSKFLKDYAFSGPPYTTATELVKYFRAEAPPEYQETITDLFERIVLYDLQTTNATSTKRADGKYVVKFTVTSKKLRSEALGEEKPAPLNEWIDIGIFAPGKKDRLGKPLFVEKRRITKPTETFEIVVNEEPARAGIDPFNKLIDRNPGDNTKSL